jgi:beta-lactam-binding protein with PASTA domain
MLLIFLLVVGIFFYIYLPNTTRHGETIEVPVLKGLKFEQMVELLETKKLRYQINDSTYMPQLKPNTIIEQTPSGGSLVKENRMIYLTISSVTPPKIKMPKLVDGSLKSAEITLKGYGLELGEVKNVTSPYLNLVLEQSYQGRPIQAGAYIAKGSKIDLMVGDGVGGEEVAVPALTGMNLEDAKNILLEKGFNIGLEHIDSESNESAGIVTKQKPEKGSALKVGGMVDIWVAE